MQDDFITYLNGDYGTLYTHQSCINISLKVNISATVNKNKRKRTFDGDTSPKRLNLRFLPGTSDFNFKNNCLICTKVINNNNLKSDSIQLVTKPDFGNEFCKHTTTN